MKHDPTTPKLDDEGSHLPNGIGRANGPGEGVLLGRWFRYPAGFSSVSLDRSFRAIRVRRGALIVDPFAGVATAGVAAIVRGYAFHGIEAHPLIAELGQIKFARVGSRGELRAAASAVVARARARPIEQIEETALVDSSFGEEVLAELVGLRETIRASRSPWRLNLKWALLASLRELASVNVSWPYQLPGQARQARYRRPTERFLHRVNIMADDLDLIPQTGRAAVVQGDSRLGSAWSMVEPRSVGACISSPPYLNNFDYADATRLESYFWGEYRSWADLTKYVRSEMVRAASHQTTDTAAATARESLSSVPRSQAEVERLECQLALERSKRPRGKEYDRMLVCYSADMLEVLRHLYRVLRPGADCAWTVGDSAPYGVHIDTPALIGLFASDVGFDVLGTETLRERGLRWRSNGTRHQVALCEKLLLFRRPGASTSRSRPVPLPLGGS